MRVSDSDKYKMIVVVSSVLLSITAVLAGYSKDFYEITECKSEVKRYVTAEYSETTVSMCIDADGGAYTCFDTDYWSESASDVYQVETINGREIITSHDFNINMVGLVAYPPMPESWSFKSAESNFDRYKQQTSTNLSVYAAGDKGATNFNEPISKSESCYESVGNMAVIKLWYGITYGSDF